MPLSRMHSSRGIVETSQGERPQLLLSVAGVVSLAQTLLMIGDREFQWPGLRQGAAGTAYFEPGGVSLWDCPLERIGGLRPGARRSRTTYSGPYQYRPPPECLIQAAGDSWQNWAQGRHADSARVRLPLARVRWSYRLGAARSKSVSNRRRQLNPSARQRAFYHARLHFRRLWTAQVDGH